MCEANNRRAWGVGVGGAAMGRHIRWLVAGAVTVTLVQGATLAAERVVLKIEGLTRFG